MSKRRAISTLGHSTDPANGHRASLRVLQHTGLHAENPESLSVYRQGGAQVEGNRLYVSAAMVAEALCERRFTFCIIRWMVSSLQLDISVTDIQLE